MKYINKTSGDIISAETYQMLSPEGKAKFIVVKDTIDSGMSLGEGIATTAAIVVLSPVILIEGLKNLFD